MFGSELGEPEGRASELTKHRHFSGKSPHRTKFFAASGKTTQNLSKPQGDENERKEKNTTKRQKFENVVKK